MTLGGTSMELDFSSFQSLAGQISTANELLSGIRPPNPITSQPIQNQVSATGTPTMFSPIVLVIIGTIAVLFLLFSDKIFNW